MFNFFKKQEVPRKEDNNSFFNGDSSKGVLHKSPTYEAMYNTSVQVQPTMSESGMDSSCYSNAYNPSFDFAVNPIIYNWYSSNAFIGFPTMAIIAQNHFISKACSIPVKDAIRKGWEVTCNEDKEIQPEIFERIKELDKQFKIREKLINQSYFTKVFGIRVAIFVVESTDSEYYEKPFNIDGVKKGAFKGIKQVDPYWCTPYPTTANLIDPTNLDFYEPTYWYVNGKKFHKTHLVITKGEEVSDILKPTYQYAGLSLAQKIYQRLYSSEKLADEVPKLALSKRTNVYKITGISKALGNLDKFKQKMNEWVSLKDNYGVKFADKEDEIQQLDTSLADLDVNIMTQFQLVCAIANIPSYKFLNAPMKGFSSGETEESSYHEYLENLQDYELTPLLDKYYELVIKSYIEPEFKTTFNPTVKFNELDSIGEKERAEINQIKSATDLNYVSAGILLAEDIQQKLIKDETSDFNGIELTKPEEFDLSEYENPINENSATDENINNGTFVSMELINSDEFYKWFKNQGVECEAPNNLHCTIAYSKKWFEHKINPSQVIINPKQFKSIQPLGNDGAIVLKFDSQEMQDRFNQCIKEGATYDYESYQPHITITYNGKDLDIDKIKMPNFPIALKWEKVEPLVLNWKDKLSTSNGMDFIKKVNDLYFVYSETGKKLSDGYKTENEAKERLREIEHFKAKGN